MRGDLLQELAYKIMEAEIGHDMLSASGRTRKVGGIFQSQRRVSLVLGPESQAQEPGCPRAGEMDVPAQEE